MIQINRFFIVIVLLIEALSASGAILTAQDMQWCTLQEVDAVIETRKGTMFSDSAFCAAHQALMPAVRLCLEDFSGVFDDSVGFVRESDRQALRRQLGSFAQALDMMDVGDYAAALGQVRSLIREMDLGRVEDADYMCLVGADLRPSDVLLPLAQICGVFSEWQLSRLYQREALSSGDAERAVVALQYQLRMEADLLHAFDTQATGSLPRLLDSYFIDSAQAQRAGEFLSSLQLFYNEWQISYFTNVSQSVLRRQPLGTPFALRLLRMLTSRWDAAGELAPYPDGGMGDFGQLLAGHWLINAETLHNNFHHAYLAALDLRQHIADHFASYYLSQPFVIYEAGLRWSISMADEATRRDFLEEYIDHMLRVAPGTLDLAPFLRMYYDIMYDSEFVDNTDYHWVEPTDPARVDTVDFPGTIGSGLSAYHYREMDSEQLRHLIVGLSGRLAEAMVGQYVALGDRARNDAYVGYFVESVVSGLSSVLYSMYFDGYGLLGNVQPDSDEHILALAVAQRIKRWYEMLDRTSVFTLYYAGLAAYTRADYREAYSCLSRAALEPSNLMCACHALYYALKSAEMADCLVEAEGLMDEFHSRLSPLLYSEFPTLGEYDIERYWSLYERIGRQINHLCLHGGADARWPQVYDNILAVKGFLTDQKQAVDAASRILTPDERQAYDTMRQIQDQYRSTSDVHLLSSSAYMQAEAKVMSRVKEIFGQAMMRRVTMFDLQSALTPEECAIEFYDAADVGSGRTGCSELYALVVRGGGAPLLVSRLGEWPDHTGAWSEADLQRLYQAFWLPLSDATAGASRIYFSLDRGIEELPVEYAISPTGAIVAELWECFRLSSTRQLCQRQVGGSGEQQSVLYGGLDFEDSDRPERVSGAKRSGTRGSKDYLWGSLDEVEGIAAQMLQLGRQHSKYVRTLGTEASFTALDGRRVDVLHLATHGLCFDDEVMADEYANVSGVELFDIIRRTSSAGRSSLWRNALALSGCNRTLTGLDQRSPTYTDGILTAAEISQLDLRGVDLVVLSSCHSGYYGGADGYGLQRGFKLAGVSSLIMTLWDVDDDAMQQLMSEFYRHYLAGADKRSALLAAQQSLRQQADYRDPQFWAGVILVDGH